MSCGTNHKCPQSIIHIFQISKRRHREAQLLAQGPARQMGTGLKPYHLTAKSFLFLFCYLTKLKAEGYHYGMEQDGKSSWTWRRPGRVFSSSATFYIPETFLKQMLSILVSESAFVVLGISSSIIFFIFEILHHKDI